MLYITVIDLHMLNCPYIPGTKSCTMPLTHLPLSPLSSNPPFSPPSTLIYSSCNAPTKQFVKC